MCKFSSQVAKYHKLSQEIKNLQEEQKKLKAEIESQSVWVEEAQSSASSKKLKVKEGDLQLEVTLSDVITTEIDNTVMVPLFEQRGLAGAIMKSVTKDGLKLAVNNGVITKEEAEQATKIKSCYTMLKVKEVKK